METALIIVQIVLAILLIVSILLQEKGDGLGQALTGSAAGSFQTQKRGAEKVLARITVALVVLFLAASLALNFI